MYNMSMPAEPQGSQSAPTMMPEPQTVQMPHPAVYGQSSGGVRYRTSVHTSDAWNFPAPHVQDGSLQVPPAWGKAGSETDHTSYSSSLQPVGQTCNFPCYRQDKGKPTRPTATASHGSHGGSGGCCVIM